MGGTKRKELGYADAPGWSADNRFFCEGCMYYNVIWGKCFCMESIRYNKEFDSKIMGCCDKYDCDDPKHYTYKYMQKG